jgi:hypothetical protein
MARASATFAAGRASKAVRMACRAGSAGAGTSGVGVGVAGVFGGPTGPKRGPLSAASCAEVRFSPRICVVGRGFESPRSPFQPCCGRSAPQSVQVCARCEDCPGWAQVRALRSGGGALLGRCAEPAHPALLPPPHPRGRRDNAQALGLGHSSWGFRGQPPTPPPQRRARGPPGTQAPRALPAGRGGPGAATEAPGADSPPFRCLGVWGLEQRSVSEQRTTPAAQRIRVCPDQPVGLRARSALGRSTPALKCPMIFALVCPGLP